MRLNLLVYRACGAAFLDAGTYEGVEHDRSATLHAGLIVVVSSIAAGVGAGGWHGPRLVTTAVCTGIALLTWLVWAFLTFEIGTRLLPGPETESSIGELLRTVGFAAAPGVLQIFAAFPRVTVPVFVGSWIWMFLAMVVAVKHALDFPRLSRALAVCGLGAALIVATFLGIGVAFGPSVS